MKNKQLISSILLLMCFFVGSAQAMTSEFVKRAIITSGIENREPVNDLQQVDGDTNKVYFFTEVINQADTMVTHRWFLNGRLEAEVVLKIGSNRWRTYSSKNLVPEFHSGDWQVEIVDQNNKVIGSATFQY